MKGISILFLGITVAAARELPLASAANEQILADEKTDTLLPLSRIAVPSETENENIHGNFNNGTLRQGCPSIADIPIADPDLKHFYGARMYDGSGNPVPSLACNGNKYDHLAGYRNPSNNLYFGSTFIHPGCQLYAFYDHNYQGLPLEIHGPVAGYDNPNHITIASYIVECQQSMPDCTPSDGWKSVAYMDNSGSSIPTKFTYQYTIGTQWSSEVSQGFDVSVSVAATIQASFFGIFSGEGSTTFSTGYNWQSTSSEAKSEETSYTIETEIPAGKILKIEQARGLCGDSEVKTEMFRNTDMRTRVSTTFVH